MNKLFKLSTAAVAVVAFVAFSMMTTNTASAQHFGHGHGHGGHSSHFRGGHGGHYGGGHGIRIGGSGISIGIGTGYGGYNRGFSGYSGYNRGISLNYNRGGVYGGYSNYRRPTFHNTTHLDYHGPEVIRHGNHYDYVPGHYDVHRTGHWHR